MFFTDPQFGLLIHAITPTEGLWVFSLVLALGLVCVNKKNEALAFIAALIATTASVFFLKLIFATPRPEDALIVLTSYAFPSGHAASGAFLAVMLSWLYMKDRRPTYFHIFICALFVLAGFILGYSRLLVGVHTPLQIVAGFLIGSIVSFSIILLYSKNYFSFFGK